MIRLYSGTPGSGKSLHAAKDIYTSLRFGQNVITNFPVKYDSFPKNLRDKARRLILFVPNSKLTVAFLTDYSRQNHNTKKENQTLLIIDEAAVLFNPRDSAKGTRVQWVQFFAQHRKLGYEITLITQGATLLDTQIRLCVETEYIHRAYKYYGTAGWLVSLIFGGMFAYVEMWYSVKIKTGSGSFRYRKRYADIYDTFALFTSDDKGISPQIDRDLEDEINLEFNSISL